MSADDEMGFAFDLARTVLAVHEAEPPATVRDALLAFYAKQTRGGRRRAVVHDALERAARFGADRVMERLSERYVDDAEPGTVERRRAERLYSRALVGRAYRREAAGYRTEARADFEAVAKRTGAYEAVAAAIDVRLRSGEKREAITADYAARGATPALVSFVEAYLLTTSLPELDDKRRREAAARAFDVIRRSWRELKDNGIVQSLLGSLVHEQYLEKHELDLAERANVHYLVALDLLRADPRYRALVLDQLLLLQMEVGNFRIALGHAESRDALPYVDDPVGLAVRLAKARVLLHTGKDADAAKAADAAVAMVDRAPALAAYRALALDRAALDNLAAQQFARARKLYDLEIPLVDQGHEDRAARHNRFVVRL